MKSILLKTALLLTALIATMLSVAIRLDYDVKKKWLLDKDIIYDTDTYGDLYHICLIEDFRIPVEPRIRQYQFSEKHPSSDDAEMFILGDSFLDHPRQIGIPELISDSLRIKVFYDSHYLSPLFMMGHYGIEKGKRRVLVLEVVERYLNTIDPMLPSDQEIGQNKLEEQIEASKPVPIINAFTGILDYFFPGNQDVEFEYFLNRSKYIGRITSFISTVRFRLFGYINEMTPVYSRNPPFLFYHESVDQSKHSYFHNHTDEEIRGVAANLAYMRDYLSLTYNLELVVMPVPNKITIYNEFVTGVPYDNYLPRLYRELENEGVHVIKLYDDFRKSKELMYYPNDTHWNTDGMNMGYQKTVEKLLELGKFDL